MAGGDPAQNASIAADILAGRPGPRRDIVLLNAAAALIVAGIAADLRDGATLAARSIDSGEAGRVLEKVRAIAPRRDGSA